MFEVSISSDINSDSSRRCVDVKIPSLGYSGVEKRVSPKAFCLLEWSMVWGWLGGDAPHILENQG